MTLTPRFQFGAIRGVISASFSFSRGTSPSVCTITVPPSVTTDKTPKPMIWSDGQRQVLFRDCIATDVAATVDGQGFQSLVISILDRRWKWKFSQISGRYNVRSGGVIIEETRKTVQQLAEICLNELGEKNYSVKLMPNDTYPHVDWDLMPVNAALDQLCQLVNCHVVLTEKDSVVIYPEGTGKDLPNLPNSSRGIAFNFGALPGKVGITSAPAMWQLDFDLIPVGLDGDGEIKSIYDLSYIPVDVVTGQKTWAFESERHLNIETRYRKLAQESVWRWYMIVPPGWSKVDKEGAKLTVVAGSHGMTELPGVKDAKLKIQNARQFFPLLDHQLDYHEVSAADRIKLSQGKLDAKQRARKPAQVIGLFYDEMGRGSDNWEPDVEDDSDFHEKDEHLIYQKSFQIDNDRGIVIFADPVYRFKLIKGPNRAKAIEQRVAAEIRLRVAANFYSAETRAAYRVFKTLPIPNAPDPKLVAWSGREDTILEVVARHDQQLGKTQFDPNDTNIQEVNERLNYYLKYSMKKYETKTPAQARYPFLVPYAPDGVIAQVIYEIGGDGFLSTSVHKEREEISNLTTYDERRQAVQARATMDYLAKQAGAQSTKKDGK